MRAAVAIFLVGCAGEGSLSLANAPTPASTEHQRTNKKRVDHRTKSEKVMLASAALWGVTLGTGAVGATILGAGVAGRDFAVELTGGGSLLFITAPLFLGALTTTMAASALYSDEP